MTKLPEIVGFKLTEKGSANEHPFESLYVIIVFPADIPETNPKGDIVATEVLVEVHANVAAAVPEPVNCVVELIQVELFPIIVGIGLIVTTTGLIVEQPFKSVPFI